MLLAARANVNDRNRSGAGDLDVTAVANEDQFFWPWLSLSQYGPLSSIVIHCLSGRGGDLLRNCQSEATPWDLACRSSAMEKLLEAFGANPVGVSQGHHQRISLSIISYPVPVPQERFRLTIPT